MQILILQDDKEQKEKYISEMREFAPQTSEYDIGCGADWYFTLVDLTAFIFASVTYLFFQGKKIEENIEAWIKISKRLKKSLPKKTMFFIDKDYALLIAINEIRKKEKNIKSLKLIDFRELNINGIDQLYRDGRQKGDLQSNPYNFYHFIIEVNEVEQFIFGIKSNGKIRYKEAFIADRIYYSYDWKDFEKREDYYS